MRTQNSDTLIAALRSDLPSAEDDARMRAKLAAAGACVGASMIGAAALQASVNTGAASGALLTATHGSTAAASLKGGGLLSTIVGALPLSGAAGVKALVVVSALATGVSYPLVAPKVAHLFSRNEERQELIAKVNGTRALTPATHHPADRGRAALPIEARREGQEAERVVVKVSSERSAAVRTNASGSMSAKTAGSKKDTRGESPTASITSAPSNERVAPASNNASSLGVLAEETQLIERALQAQREGDTRAARGWLSMHQQRFPDGELTTERTRIWTQLHD